MNPTTTAPSFTPGQIKEILTKRLDSTLALPDYERNPHITHDIFGIPQAQTQQVVVVDAFTSCGKTHDVIHWLAKNINNRETNKLIIAFREVQLACEAAVAFYAACREIGDKHYENAKKKCMFQFQVTDEHLASYEELSAKHGGDFSKVLNFMKNTSAKTDLRDGRVEQLHKAKVVFTTHESLLTIAKVGVSAKRDIIIDEAPANYHDMIEVTSDAEAHIDLYSKLAIVKDHNLVDGTRIAKLVQNGIFKFLPLIYVKFDLSSEELFSNDAETTTLTELPWGISGSSDNSDLGSVSKTQGNSPTVEKYLPVAVNFQSFGAKSITIMSAFAKGTDIRVIERLSGEQFIYVDAPASASRRTAVADRVLYVNTPEKCSCAKAVRGSREAKEAKKVIEGLVQKFGSAALGVCHHWGSEIFKKYGAPFVKLNSTGLNLYKDKSAVIVANLKFMSPQEKAMWKATFGEEFEAYNKAYLVNGLMQSVMRSSLRDRNNDEVVVIVSPDERVKELIMEGLDAGIRVAPYDRLSELIDEAYTA
jgi:hypothetical protein